MDQYNWLLTQKTPWYKIIILENTKQTINQSFVTGTIMTVETEHIKSYESFKNELDPETIKPIVW